MNVNVLNNRAYIIKEYGKTNSIYIEGEILYMRYIPSLLKIISNCMVYLLAIGFQMSMTFILDQLNIEQWLSSTYVQWLYDASQITMNMYFIWYIWLVILLYGGYFIWNYSVIKMPLIFGWNTIKPFIAAKCKQISIAEKVKCEKTNFAEMMEPKPTNEFWSWNMPNVTLTRKHESINVSVPKIDSKAANYISDNIGDVELTTSKIVVPHILDNSMRHIVNEYVMSLLPVGQFGIIMDNPKYYEPDGKRFLIPIVDSKDSQRYAQRVEWIKSKAAKGIFYDYAITKFEDDIYKADYVVSMQSHWDQDPSIFFTACYKKHIKNIFLINNFNVSMLVHKIGCLKLLKMYFWIEKNGHGVEMIYMYFYETGKIFVHKYENVIRFMNTKHVIVSNEHYYTNNIEHVFEDVIVLRYSLMKGEPTDIEERMYVDKHASKFIYTHLELKAEYVYTGMRSMIRVITPRDLYNHLLAASTAANGKIMNADSLNATCASIGESWYSDHYHPYMENYHSNGLMKPIIETISKTASIQRQIDDYNNAFKDIKLNNIITKLFNIIIGTIDMWRLIEERKQLASDLPDRVTVIMGIMDVTQETIEIKLNSSILQGSEYEKLRRSALECTLPDYTYNMVINTDICIASVVSDVTGNKRYEPRRKSILEAAYPNLIGCQSNYIGTKIDTNKLTFLSNVSFVIFDDQIAYTNRQLTNTAELMLVLELERDDNGNIIGCYRCKSMEMQEMSSYIAMQTYTPFVGTTSEIYWAIELNLEFVESPICFFKAYGYPYYSVSGLGTKETMQTKYYTGNGIKALAFCSPVEIKSVAIRENVCIIDKSEVFIPRQTDVIRYNEPLYGNPLKNPFAGNDEDVGKNNTVSSSSSSVNVTEVLRLDDKSVTVEELKYVKHFCYVVQSHVWKIKNVSNVIEYCNNEVEWFRNILRYEKPLNGIITLEQQFNYNLNVIENFKLRLLKINNDKRKLCLLSIYEVLHYTLISERSVLNMFHNAYKVLKTSTLTSFKKIKVYDVKRKRFITDLPNRVPTLGYSNGEYIEVTWDRKTGSLVDLKIVYDYILFSDELLYLREKKILENFLPLLDNLLEHDFDNIRFNLHKGPPGCGKTTLIKKYHKPGMDLVFTECKAGNEAYREWLSNKAFINYYLTYDAALVNKNVVKAYNSWNDEAYMPHFGVLCLIAYKCGIRIMNLVGDPSQIPFLSRVAQYKLYYESINNRILDDIKEVFGTWRLPKNAMNYMRKIIPNIFTYSEIIGETKVIKITMPIVIADASVILTFTKEEKAEMIKINPSVRVFTVNEAQGLDFENVALVRLRMHYIGLYFDDRQILVAITRQKRNLTYYTVKDDKTSDLLQYGTYEFEDPELTIDDLYTVMTKKHTGIVKPIYGRYNLKWRDMPTAEREYALTRGIVNETILNKPSIKVYYLEFPEITNGYSEVEVITIQAVYNAIFGIPNEQTLIKQLNEPITIIDKKGIKAVSWKLIHAEVKNREKNTRQNYLNPVLKTRQPKPYSDLTIETEVSIESRVRDAPDTSLLVTPTVEHDAVKRFFSTYIDDKKHKDSEIMFDYASEEAIVSWYNDLNGDRTTKLNAETAMKNFYAIGVYTCHIKKDHKPNLSKENYGIQGGQLIAAMPSLETFKFACHFKTFIARLKYSLKEKFMIFDGYKVEHLNGFLNQFMGEYKYYIPKEIDFSKFDKSQNELLGEIQLQIFVRYGVPNHVLKDWLAWHTTNILQFKNCGISVRTTYQRRSGDIMTFIGNTIVSMVVLAYGYDYSDCILGIFAGDDSIFILKKDTLRTDESKIAQEVFNLEAKLLNFPESPMFISKIMVYCKGYYYFVPDAIKAITRLGRNNLQCGEHVEEYYKSFKDNYKMYANLDIRLAVAIALKKRYSKTSKNKVTNYMVFCDFIANLLTDKEKFKRLFVGDRNLWERKLSKKEHSITPYLVYDELLTEWE